MSKLKRILNERRENYDKLYHKKLKKPYSTSTDPRIRSIAEKLHKEVAIDPKKVSKKIYEKAPNETIRNLLFYEIIDILSEASKGYINTTLNDEILIALLNPRITRLNLSRSPFITNLALIKIGEHCPNLQHLSVERGLDSLRLKYNEYLSKLNDEGVVELVSNCHKIKHLDIGWCYLTNQSVFAIAKNCPELEFLNLNGNHQIDDSGINELSKNCRHLKVLKLQDCCIEDISSIGTYKLPLEELYLYRCDNVSNESLKTIIKNCGKTLIHLELASVRDLQDDALDLIGKHCKKLVYLGIRACRKISTEAFKDVIQKCDSLFKYDLFYSGVDPSFKF